MAEAREAIPQRKPDAKLRFRGRAAELASRTKSEERLTSGPDAGKTVEDARRQLAQEFARPALELNSKEKEEAGKNISTVGRASESGTFIAAPPDTKTHTVGFYGSFLMGREASSKDQLLPSEYC